MKQYAVCKSGISALGAALFFAGCAPVPALRTPAGVKVSAVAAVHADGMPSRRARLTWERIGGRDVAEIKTPLGTSRARVVIEDGDAAVFAGGKQIPPEETGAEVNRWLKLLPPPQSFGYWLLGESDPAYSSRETFTADKPGVGRIMQHGWEIIYAERDEEGRPARIELRADAPDSPGAAQNARAEVKIFKWFPIP